jgi:hypothetical protein
MTTANEKKILQAIRKGLNPPTEEELTQVTAKWLFGKKADKMVKHAPWSFILVKLMWKKGEEPWAS